MNGQIISNIAGNNGEVHQVTRRFEEEKPEPSPTLTTIVTENPEPSSTPEISEEPEVTEEPRIKESPQTGDRTNIITMFGILVVSAGVIILDAIFSKKKK